MDLTSSSAPTPTLLPTLTPTLTAATPRSTLTTTAVSVDTTPQSPEYFKPFTLIFFSRKQDPITDLLEVATVRALKLNPSAGDVWTHVGIVITRQVCPSFVPLKPLPSDTNQTPYLWESTLSSSNRLFTALEHIADAETGKYMFGVQIRRLTTVLDAASQMGIKTSYTRDYIRSCSNPAQFSSPTAAFISSVGALKSQFTQRKYATSPFPIYAAFHENGDATTVAPAISTDINSANAVFSSQFVTLLYQAWGIISATGSISARTMLPHELAVPSVSDNAEFASAWGKRVGAVKYINASDVPTSSNYLCANGLCYLGHQALLWAYQHKVMDSLQAIVDRVPSNDPLTAVLKTAVDAGVQLLDAAATEPTGPPAL